MEDGKEGIEVLKQVRQMSAVLAYVMKDIDVILPDRMIEIMQFPVGLMRYRRDHATFLDILITVGYMRQYEKEVMMHEYKSDGENRTMRYVECDCRDYEIAYSLFLEHMKNDSSFDSFDDLEVITTPEEMQSKISAM